MLAEVAVRVDGDPDAATSLLAEIAGMAEIANRPFSGLAGAMVERAQAIIGRPDAADGLVRSARQLAAPALLITRQLAD
jgi:hypothetical protein